MSDLHMISPSPDDLMRFDTAAPRYTSYPTAVHFHGGVDTAHYRERLQAASQRVDEPMSLYVHVPFCNKMCAFCGCTTWIPKGEALPERYFAALEKEYETVTALLGERRKLVQMHWGGGTPNFLSLERTEWLMELLTRHFEFVDGAELAIEVHPGWMDPGRIAHYAKLGVNRVSMGVQDFNPKVQEAIGRIQSFEDTARVVREARENGFTGANMDLVYGLPFQSLDTINETLDRVLEIRPDRIAA